MSFLNFLKGWYANPWSNGTVYDKALTIALALCVVWVVVRMGREARG